MKNFKSHFFKETCKPDDTEVDINDFMTQTQVLFIKVEIIGDIFFYYLKLFIISYWLLIEEENTANNGKYYLVFLL